MTKLHKIKIEDAKVGDYGFWRYDQFPFLLGGQIGSRPGRTTLLPISPALGQAYVPSYQMAFKMEFCLSRKDGAYLIDELVRLSFKHMDATRQLDLMMEKARQLVLGHLTDEPAPDSTDQPQWLVEWRTTKMVKPDFYRELVHAPTMEAAMVFVTEREGVEVEFVIVKRTMTAKGESACPKG